MQYSDRSQTDALLVIRNRRSVRRFTSQAVAEEDIDALLRAGMAAPTARNRQPWSFVVITQRAVLDHLAEGLSYGKMLSSATAAIAVCALPEQANSNMTELAVIDATCAAENMLLAIHALGLGGVWVAAYPYGDRMDHVRSVLGIPAAVIPLNVIAVGYAADEKPPLDKYRQDKIHRERWG